ncbi:MAG: carbon-nitrogen hydrolase family protein [Paracoccaceae bacterium]|nr:carbon-nitrogen hydrolase family protein [Paracoccaceae bacterium]
MRVALVQLTVTDDPIANLAVTLGFLDQAIAGGAEFILTPECTNALSSNRDHLKKILYHQDEDPTLKAMQTRAKSASVWILVGSLGLLTRDSDARFANRSFLIDPLGQIVAQYDKIHMFDVTLSESEVYRESASYRPGDQAVLGMVAGARVGLTICYDVRFSALYRRLAQAGAQILTVPAAFNHITGAAHWHVLLRARAIETGCFVLAPAQTGFHPEAQGKGRKTFGCSLIISPWGEVLSDAGTSAGVTFATLDLGAVDQARAKVGSLQHDRKIEGPDV